MKKSVKLIDDERILHSPKSVSEDDEHEKPLSPEDELDILRKKFVGEIDLPEGLYYTGIYSHIQC